MDSEVSYGFFLYSTIPLPGFAQLPLNLELFYNFASTLPYIRPLLPNSRLSQSPSNVVESGVTTLSCSRINVDDIYNHV